MNTTQGFQFFMRKYPWIPLNSSKISMNTRSQNKKNMRGFHWNPALVIFLPKMQLYSLYIKSNSLYKNIHVLISTSIIFMFSYLAQKGHYKLNNGSKMALGFKIHCFLISYMGVLIMLNNYNFRLYSRQFLLNEKKCVFRLFWTFW